MRQVVRTHFVINTSPVSFDGLGTDPQSRADVPAGKSFDDQIKNYVIQLVLATRRGEKLLPELQRMVRCGASPRATINLTLAARAHALLQGQAFVSPDDVKAIAFDVLRHRILLTYEAEAEEVTTDSLVQTILSKVPVP